MQDSPFPKFDAGLKIADITAIPTSFPLPKGSNVRLGIGRAVKRDAIVVRVRTQSGLVGYGESHAGRAPGAVAALVNTTLRALVLGMDATDVVGVWNRIYSRQLASHGMGAGCSLAMSGLDMALWDIRGKAVGWPLYKLLGGAQRSISAYAGGVSLGFQDPKDLVAEAKVHVDAGYRAIKLRLGDNVRDDIRRVEAARDAFGEEMEILTDANTGYTVEDARRVMPALEDLEVRWLEEPFPAHDYRSYSTARSFSTTPLAAGENHFTRFEFSRLIEEANVDVIQPDLSKSGGITECLRIAAMASAHKLPIHPHSSMTGINMAATIHFLAAIDNGGYFEGDVSKDNLFRDELTSRPYELAKDGTVRPLEAPGIGVEVDEKFLQSHPIIDGPGYV
ncbi:MAG TPA: mandelate racemase/muconate lactonizing enzyme family protein [Usitatibacter sp.]|jgi:L-alanine-DL-glutamate epimerase-like enolase superfamily enzyme|nr:mandelate racemase/muconate lactonizing enzyme family protein [Usitatibacter sp.]